MDKIKVKWTDIYYYPRWACVGNEIRSVESDYKGVVMGVFENHLLVLCDDKKIRKAPVRDVEYISR